jgi:multidrug resistance efflux pump
LRFNRRLFREEAVLKQGQVEPVDTLLRVTAPHEWLILAGLGIVLLGAVVWSVFGTVERTASAGCILAKPGERHAVFSTAAGSVAEFLVDPGDWVEAGDPIIRLEQPEVDRQVRIARAQVELVESGPQDGTGDAALAAARVALRELEALEAEGALIVSLYTGEVAATEVLLGQAVGAGEEVAWIRSGESGRLEVWAVMSDAEARRVEHGMAARVRLDESGGDRRTLKARISQVAGDSEEVPAWFGGDALSQQERLVRADLLEAPGSAPNSDGGCLLNVVLSRQAPIRLLI